MKTNEYYIKEAIKEAKKAEAIGEVPVGVVIVVDGKIIARAHNLRKTKNNAIYHAEILAIDKACKKLNRWILDDATMYITLEPCIMCSGAIIQSRIKKVVYGAKDFRYGCGGSLMNILENDCFNHCVEVENGVLNEEISNMMTLFFKKIRENKKNN